MSSPNFAKRSGPMFLSILLVLSALIPAAGSLYAVPTRLFNVSTTRDSNDGACDSHCSLREAIIAANASPGKDTILVPAGRYILTIPSDDGGINGGLDSNGAVGDLDIIDSLALHGAASSSTIIDANGLDRVFDIRQSGILVDMSNITIQRGYAPLGPGSDFRFEAGGIRNAGKLILINTIIQDNIAGLGAGIFNYGSVTLISSTVRRNRAEIGASGGGISSSGRLVIDSSIISENRANSGGGIDSSGVLTLTNTIVVSNHNGGLETSGRTIVLNSTIRNNTNIGGLLHYGITDTDTVTIIGSTISANTGNSFGSYPDYGGGINLRRGSMSIVNSTLSANTTTRSGGGINVGTGMLRLNNVTITNNTADSDRDGRGDGGGIMNVSGSVIVSNNIIAGNFDNSSTGNNHLDCSGLINSANYNLIQSLSGCGFTKLSGDMSDVDPQLGLLSDNGGPTFTHSLLPTSPARDAGNPATPGSSETTCEVRDQRAVPRPMGSGCDIGAYEIKDYHVFIPSLSNN